MLYCYAVAIASLRPGGLSEEFFQPEGLECNSVLDDSLIAATTSANNIALILKHLPIKVSAVMCPKSLHLRMS